jgi:hypothetical protein
MKISKSYYWHWRVTAIVGWSVLSTADGYGWGFLLVAVMVGILTAEILERRQ